MNRMRNHIPAVTVFALSLLCAAFAPAIARAQLDPLPSSTVLGRVVGVATDAGSGRMWAVGTGGRLHEYDLETGVELRFVQLGGANLRGPEVRAGGDRLVVTNEATREVILIDTETLAVLHTTPLPSEGSHARAYFHPDGRTVRAWAAGGGIGDLVVLDSETGEILDQGRVFYGSPDDVDAVSPDGRVLFRSQITPFGESWFIEPSTGSILAAPTIAAPSRPAFTSSSDAAWLADLGLRSVRKIDLVSGDVTLLEDDIRATAVAVDDNLGVVVVAALNRVSLFDRDTNTRLAEVASTGQSGLDQYGASPIALLPGSGTAIVVREGFDRLDLIDIDPASATFATVLQSTTLAGCSGGNCEAIGVVVSRDGSRVLVPESTRSVIARYSLPLPDVSVLLIPDPETIVVAPGGRFRFDVVVTNNTSETQRVNGRVDVILPGGVPFPGNPVTGPKSVKLGPNRSVRKQLSIPVRAGAPLGAYRVTAVLELVSSEVSSHAVFFVDS